MSLAVLVANLGAQKHDADSRLARGRARSLVGTTGVLANLSSAKSSACRDQAPRKSKKSRPVGEVRLKSTGPGKASAYPGATPSGTELTAETVIDGLGDSEDYRGFEAAIIADYDAETAIERELVLRLASLLWRLRRATSIETDLLRIQAK